VTNRVAASNCRGASRFSRPLISPNCDTNRLRLPELGPAHPLGVTVQVAIHREPKVGVAALPGRTAAVTAGCGIRPSSRASHARRDVPSPRPMRSPHCRHCRSAHQLHRTGLTPTEAGAPVMVGVKEQPDHVGLAMKIVAAGEDRDDAVGVGSKARTKTYRLAAVIGDLRHGRSFGGPLRWVATPGIRDGRRPRAHGVLVAAVYDGLLRGVFAVTLLAEAAAGLPGAVAGEFGRLAGKRDGC